MTDNPLYLDYLQDLGLRLRYDMIRLVHSISFEAVYRICRGTNVQVFTVMHGHGGHTRSWRSYTVMAVIHGTGIWSL